MPTIDPRFNGPPGSGNGGYACGLVAGLLGGPAEVTLRLPPPLGTPLRWDGERLLDGDARGGRGRGWPTWTSSRLRRCPSPRRRRRRAATRASSGTPSPPASSAGRSATTATGCGSSPRRSRARTSSPRRGSRTRSRRRSSGRPSTVPARSPSAGTRAASRCSGGWPREVRELPRSGERCVVVAKPLGEDGRKLYAATALYGEDGGLLGRAAADLDRPAGVSTRLAATPRDPDRRPAVPPRRHRLPDGRGRRRPVPGQRVPGVGVGDLDDAASCRPRDRIGDRQVFVPARRRQGPPPAILLQDADGELVAYRLKADK